MADVRLEIPEEVRSFLAATIASCGGNEVFFLAHLEWDAPATARVSEVDVLARGNEAAAPAIIGRAEEWDLAIHNHPSGVLEPSDADLAVAAELGTREVGFAIIDNRAERHYLVVAPFHRTPAASPLDPAEVEAVFGPGGPIASALDDYEPRPGQVGMALEVAAAFNEDRVAAIEAGTGVGKSFAYLVPAILWAARNRKRVIVSTNTINLQEQLIGKDLPFLERTLGVKFRYALIKGRGNYACKRKLKELEADLASLFESDDEERQLRDIIAWAKSAREGSRAELGAPPPDHVWEKAMSETDKSLKVKCPFYGECFYYQAKRAAFIADVVVVNHHLFFADLAVRRATGNYEHDLVIPGYRRVIFDEAHHLEDVASQYLGAHVSQIGLRTRFGRLVSRKDHGKGMLPALAHRLRKDAAPVSAETLETGLLVEVPRAAARVEEEFQSLLASVEAEARRAAAAAKADDERAEAEMHVRLTGEPGQAALVRAIEAGMHAVLEELGVLQQHARRAAAAIESDSGIPDDRRESFLLEPSSLVDRLAAAGEEIEFFLDFADQTHVRWAEVRGRPDWPERRGVNFATAPIRVASDLKSAIYDPLRTVVMTSATLSVEGEVKFLGDRLGFDQVAEERFRFRSFPSPFDFGTQVLTLVPDDLPDPGAPGFGDRMADVVLSVLQRTGGRAFVLFTSYGLLRRTYEALQGPLADAGIRALRQGDAGRSELLRRFRSGPPHALFGTDSFWEGVDVKGEALECVVITRLPFRVPTEPIQVARIEDLEKRGHNPFSAFTVPQAVLKFKQGFGRLIRSSADRGVVVVLDRRVVTKRYGQSFLRSLPPTAFFRGPTAEVVRRVGDFFRRGTPERTIGDATR